MIQQYIIMVGSRPMFRALSYGAVREWLEQQTDEVLAKVKVWRVYPDWTGQPSVDATEHFVREWMARVDTRPGYSPVYPAFVDIWLKAEQSEEVA